MKMTFIPFIIAWMLFSCGNRTANNVPQLSFTAPVEELSAALEAEEADEPAAGISWDKTVHDFGDISVADGPISCSFTLTNSGQEAIAIFEVVSSCGCTDVKWTREPILPGKSGTISATYKNEDGPMPFDKTLTVYISGVKRPVILRLRGVVHEKKKSPSQLYGAQKLGAFGLKTRQFKTGTLRQGLSCSESATVANLGNKPLAVSFADVSPELSLSVSPNPIPAGGTATLQLSVRSNPELYGKNSYFGTPVLNGRKAEAPLEVISWTQENFSHMDQAARDQAPLPYFQSSTVSFGTLSKGEKVQLDFVCTNRGATPFHVFKADSESSALSQAAPLQDIPAGQKGELRFTLDTSLLDKGENSLMLSLTTNSPLRPLIHLFVSGIVR